MLLHSYHPFTCFGLTFACSLVSVQYTCSTIDSLLPDSINAREGNDLLPNGNDNDVIKNYITDMDLGEDSDSHTYTYTSCVLRLSYNQV